MATTEQRPGSGPEQPQPDEKGDPKTLSEPEGVAMAADEARRKALTPGQEMDATEWFLSDDERVPVWDTPVTVITQEGQEVVIKWVLRPLDGTLIDRLENESVEPIKGGEPGARALNRPLANAKLVVQATVTPRLTDEKLRHREGAPAFADAVDALRHRFRNQSGLIDQLAEQVRLRSGYGPDRIGKASMRLVNAARG